MILKVNRTAASKKANVMLGLISREMDHKSLDVMKRLYAAFATPHLEYAVQSWSPNYTKDQNLMAQRQTTKHITTLRNSTYD